VNESRYQSKENTQRNSEKNMSDEVKYIVTLSLGMSDSGGDENLMKITERRSRLRSRESGHRYGTFCDNHLL